MDERHEELRELLAPYVLGAVTPEEAELVRTHLRSCEECSEEVGAHEAAASSLTLAVEPVALPPQFAERVLARVAEDRSAAAARSVAPVAAPAGHRWFSPHLVAYAGLLLVVAVLAAGLLAARRDSTREQEVLRAVLRQDGMALEGSGGAVGRMIPTAEGGTLVVAGLEAAPNDHDYQLWLIEDCGEPNCAPRSAGTFDVSDGVTVLETDESLEAVAAAAVTIEPDGGSPRPTTDPVIASA